MKNLCSLPLVHFLYSRRMNSENSRQSLISKERRLEFALRTNSGNGPLGNKRFSARIRQRLENLFLMPFNSRNATHLVYL